MGTVRRSLGLSLADSYLGLVLQLASTMIISRILTPGEIGIVAVAAVFSGLASMFRDFGVAEYMIQEKELTNERIAAALSLNIIVSWAMAATLFTGASAVASFYGDPGITQVMRVQAIAFLLVPFGAVTMAYFRRELNYRPMLICNLAGNLTSFLVSVSLVLTGHGYMSLPWGTLAAIVVTVLGTAWFRPNSFPRLPGFSQLGHVFNFSKFASAVYMVGQFGKGAPEMVIGRAQGMAAVAMFSRANGLVEMFNRLAMRPVMSVCMPYFARSERETGAVVGAYLRSVSYVTVVGWPFLIFMALAAAPAIRVVYGPQWDAAVPIAQILCVAGCLELVHMMSREALLARGLAREANRLQIGMLVMQVTGLLAVVPFGLKGAAFGVVAASAGGILLSQHYLAKGIGLRLLDLLGACRSSLYVALLSVSPAGLWCALVAVTIDNQLAFGLGGGFSTAACWLLALWLTKHQFLDEVLTGFQRVMERFRKS